MAGMLKRCLIAVLAAAPLGCEWPPEGPGPAQDPNVAALARLNEKLSRLQMELQQRDLRIEELRERSARLAKALQEAQFTTRQLSKQLAAVGDAPRQRDHYKELANARSIETQRLLREIAALRLQLRAAATAPATAPATRPAK